VIASATSRGITLQRCSTKNMEKRQMANNSTFAAAQPQDADSFAEQIPSIENPNPATGEQPADVAAESPFAAAPNVNHSPDRREQARSVPIDTTALPTDLLSSPAASLDAQTLFGIAEHSKYFLGPNGTGHVRYRDRIAGIVFEHVEPVRSDRFVCWLTFSFFCAEGRPVLSEALQAVLDVLEARATRRNKRSPETQPCRRDDAAQHDVVTDDAQSIEPEYVGDAEPDHVDNELAVFTHASPC
jgi:hypothetical protein